MIQLENFHIVTSNDYSVRVGIFHLAHGVILRQVAVTSMLQSLRMVKETWHSHSWLCCA